MHLCVEGNKQIDSNSFLTWAVTNPLGSDQLKQTSRHPSLFHFNNKLLLPRSPRDVEFESFVSIDGLPF